MNPVLSRGNGFPSDVARPTLREREQFDCALDHVMEAYRLPRYAAADVAVRLLAWSQGPPWVPVCAHTPKHEVA